MTFHVSGRETFAPAGYCFGPDARLRALHSRRGRMRRRRARLRRLVARFKPRPRRKAYRRAAIAPRLAGLTYDPTVVRLDRSQRSFKLSFEEFYARRVGPALIRRGQSLMRTHRPR